VLGAYVVVSMTVQANEDLDVGWFGIPVAGLLVALVLLTAVRPGEAARVLRFGALLCVPVLAVLTLLTYWLERGQWHRTTIGPIVWGVLFFAIPALVVVRLLRMACEPGQGQPRPPRAQRRRGGRGTGPHPVPR
jgi:hypothetical protein